MPTTLPLHYHSVYLNHHQTLIYLSDLLLYFLVLLAVIIPFTASAGDFIASYYKRIANVKDSGIIIPGHGGILDRMDAFMITIPVLYIYINYI